jgi:hypothetical protein
MVIGGIMSKPTTIKIDDVEYVRKDLASTPAPTLEGKKYVIVRTYSAGVFAGYLDSRNGQEVVLLKARRLWQFFAASLSELAQSGTPDVSKCKFPEEVDRVELLQAIEILDVTEKAKKSIDSVKVWKA